MIDPRELDMVWEPPDADVDRGVKVRCTNAACTAGTKSAADALESGLWWHPTTFSEYQGEVPHGGIVHFHEDDAFDCETCGQEGEEF